MSGLKKEEIKKYLGYLKPLFATVGIELTEAKLNEIVESKYNVVVEENKKTVEQKLADKRVLREKLLEKYPSRIDEAQANKKKNEKGNYDNFGRIYFTMLRPGDDEESVKFNKKLSELSATYEGQREIIKMAAEMVINADKNSLYGDKKDILGNYLNHFTEFELMSISSVIKYALAGANEDQAYEGDLLERYDKNSKGTEIAMYLTPVAEYYAHPLSKYMPEGVNFNEIAEKLAVNDFFEPEMNVSGNDNKYLGDFLNIGYAQQQRLESIDGIVKKHYEENVAKKNITIEKLKGNRKDLVFIDVNGKFVPDNTVVKYDDKYAVCDNLGNIQGFHVNKDAGLEKIDAKFPEEIMRKYQSQVQTSLAAIDELTNMSEKLSGIYGEKLSLDQQFSKVAQKLENCDYKIKQNLTKDAKELLTYVTFVSPDIVKNLETSSTIAGESLEGKVEFAGVDWLVGNDNRSKGFDVALSDVRKGMAELVNSAEKGDKAKLKKDFQEAAKNCAFYFMNDPIIGMSNSSRFTLVLADKFAKVIKENPFGIADGIPEGIKNTITMKANLHKLDMKAAEAKAELLTNPDLDMDKKKELVKQVLVTREIRRIMNETAPVYDPSQHIEEIFQGITTRPERHEAYRVVAALVNDFPREFRSLEPTEIERAMAQKFPELVKAVEDSISSEDLERVANSSRFCIEDEIKNTIIPNNKINVPHTDEIKLSAEFKERKKNEFNNDMYKLIASVMEKNQLKRENGEIPDDQTGMKLIGKHSEKISWALNHTKAGITGPSAEYKAVVDAYEEMQKYINKPECTAKIYVCAKKLSQVGMEYLAKKMNQGVNPEADNRAGKRYRDVLGVIENANYIANYAKTENKLSQEYEEFVRFDHLRIDDAVHADTLLHKLKEARKNLDAADPFYYHSTDTFRAVQRTLNSSIECLESYGTKKVSEADRIKLVDALDKLSKAARTYMTDRANPGTSLGKARMSAIEVVYEVAKGQSEEIKNRNFERNENRSLLAQRYEIKKVNDANEKKLASERSKKSVAASNELEKLLDRYTKNDIKSNKSIDPSEAVTKLANRVQSTFKYMKETTKNPVGPFPTVTKKLKSILAERMILDMINEERKRAKDGVVEKAYIKDANKFKEALLKQNDVDKAMQTYLTSMNVERLAAFKTMENIALEKLVGMRTKLIEQEKQQAPAQEEKKQQVVNQEEKQIENKKTVV